MSFTDAEQTQIWGSLARFPQAQHCPTCGDNQSVLMNQVFNFAMDDPVSHEQPSERTNMPCVGLVCRLCGHVRFYNAFILGLRNLVGPSIAEVEAESRSRSAPSAAVLPAPKDSR